MQTAETTQSWSEPLLDLTRKVMDLDFVPVADFVFLKNINGQFGMISVADWLEARLRVQDRETLAESEFASVDDLIAAGWAVD